MNPPTQIAPSSLPDSLILVVDDIQQNIQVVGTMLREAGYSIMPATSGPSALQRVAKKLPDLILLDLMMPEMDGFTVLQRLRRRVRSPRVVCLTAKGSRMDRERAWRLGVDEYVTKPFALSAVLDAADAVVGRSWPERRARRWRALTELGTLP
jgi:CheY-like chemotaxis protein